MGATKQVSPGIWRLRLEAKGRLVVNAWLWRRGERNILIDTGFPQTTDQLIANIEATDLRLSDITDVFYTHTHNDHMGGGVVLKDEWAPNTRHYAFAGSGEALEDYFTFWEARRGTAGSLNSLLPDTERWRSMLAEIKSIPPAPLRVAGDGTIPNLTRVEVGATVRCGEASLRCVDARGHDPVHVAWLDVDGRRLFSGDVILRVPTPILLHMRDELFTWLDTLDRWQKSLAVDLLLPGHGMPTALFQQSIDRSRAFWQSLYTLTSEELEAGVPVDPLDITFAWLGDDRSRYAARSTVFVANTLTLLVCLQKLGFVTQLPSRHWVATRALPDFSTLRAIAATQGIRG